MASHALLTAQGGRRVISTGLQSYEKTSLLELAPLWSSLVAGLLGLLWLLVSGTIGLVARRGVRRQATFAPLIGIVALLLPLPFFLRQSFLALGDLTVASGLLAAVSLLLPLTMLVGLFRSFHQRPWSRSAKVDVVAMLAVLQWLVVLAWWGLVPLRLWD
jgi:hypothetical protein